MIYKVNKQIKKADKQRLSQQIQQYKGKRHQLDNDVESAIIN